jgi:hypothetical protein
MVNNNLIFSTVVQYDLNGGQHLWIWSISSLCKQVANITWSVQGWRYRVKKQYGKHEYLRNIILLNIESLYNIIINCYICVMGNLTGEEIIITHPSWKFCLLGTLIYTEEKEFWHHNLK